MSSRTVRDRVHRVEPDGAPGLTVDRRRRCVRCGKLPPAPELFVCGRCQADPSMMLEVRNIEEAFVDYREQRKALRLFGWAGGWWR